MNPSNTKDSYRSASGYESDNFYEEITYLKPSHQLRYDTTKDETTNVYGLITPLDPLPPKLQPRSSIEPVPSLYHHTPLKPSSLPFRPPLDPIPSLLYPHMPLESEPPRSSMNNLASRPLPAIPTRPSPGSTLSDVSFVPSRLSVETPEDSYYSEGSEPPTVLPKSPMSSMENQAPALPPKMSNISKGSEVEFLPDKIESKREGIRNIISSIQIKSLLPLVKKDVKVKEKQDVDVNNGGTRIRHRLDKAIKSLKSSSSSLLPTKRKSLSDLLANQESNADEMLISFEEDAVDKLESTSIAAKSPQYFVNLPAGEPPPLPPRPVSNSVDSRNQKLHEIKLEILMSEFSYLHSLTILNEYFVLSSALTDESVLSREHCVSLFKDVTTIHNCSKSFMKDLDNCRKTDALLGDFYEVVLKHSQGNFQHFVEYCSHQAVMTETLTKLMQVNVKMEASTGNSRFVSAIREIEAHSGCGDRPLATLLALPLNRLTHLLALVTSSLKLLHKQDGDYDICQKALIQLQKLVHECNEAVRISSIRCDRMSKLGQQLVYRPGQKVITMTSSSRWLIMSGDMTKYDYYQPDQINPESGMVVETEVCVFLLSDLLVLTKPKGASYIVERYGARNTVRADTTDTVANLHEAFAADTDRKYMMVLTMYDVLQQRSVQMFLSCVLELDRDRWLSAISTNQKASGNEPSQSNVAIKHSENMKKNSRSLEPQDLSPRMNRVQLIAKRINALQKKEIQQLLESKDGAIFV